MYGQKTGFMSCHYHYRNEHQGVQTGWWAQPLWLQGPFWGPYLSRWRTRCLVLPPSSLTVTTWTRPSTSLLKGYPSQAKNLENLLNIPEQFATTADKKRFLLLNDTVIWTILSPVLPGSLSLSQVLQDLVCGWHSTHYSPRWAKNV
jgi:hypothetical protein